MNKKLIAIVVIILILAGITAGFYLSKINSKIQDTPTTVSGNIISINNFAFTPRTLVIKTGEKVTWQNNESVAHTIVSSGFFQSQVLNRGDEFSFTFPQAGTYDYYCGIHPSMKGKIIVQ